jgi:uncharacterized protein YchJ
MSPKRTLSHDPCTCGSGRPYGECCARQAGVVIPALAR